MALRATMTEQLHLKAWAEVKLDMEPGSFAPDAVAMGIFDGDDLLAVILYNAHYGHYLSMHVATSGSRRWLNRSILSMVFGYAFHHRGVFRVNAMVRQDDLKTQMMCLKLGFRIEATIRCGADDGSNGILFGMLKPECPWLKQQEVAGHG